jgi:hypothetical protein
MESAVSISSICRRIVHPPGPGLIIQVRYTGGSADADWST